MGQCSSKKKKEVVSQSLSRKKEEVTGQWSELPVDLLMAIEEHLVMCTDIVRLRSVCASWRSKLPKMPNHKHFQLPWLLLPNSNDKTSFEFFNPLEKRVYNIEVPEPQGKLFRGSSHGWVVTIEESSTIYVLNPLTGTQVLLPPRFTFPDVVEYRAGKPGKEHALRYTHCSHGFYTSSSTYAHFLTKVILSSHPTSMDWVAVAIYGDDDRLAYCRYGDKGWTSLHEGLFYADVIFHKERLYAINDSKLMAFDIGSCTKVTQIVSSTETHDDPLYLVESGGELMMVERNVTETYSDDPKQQKRYRTHGFKIYKLDTSSSIWCQVKNLGDDDLFFVGYNSSLAFSSRDFPGYKGNCIYFTDNLLEYHIKGVKGGHDIGLFNVDDGTIEPLPGYTSEAHLVWPPPIWVMPNPYN